MFVLSVVYTAAWLRGIWMHWIVPARRRAQGDVMDAIKLTVPGAAPTQLQADLAAALAFHRDRGVTPEVAFGAHAELETWDDQGIDESSEPPAVDLSCRYGIKP